MTGNGIYLDIDTICVSPWKELLKEDVVLGDQPIKGGYSKKKVNTFESVFPTSNPKFVLVVMLDEPKANKEFVYHYRDDRNPYKGNWRNTAGWTTVWVTGQIIERIGPILATKY